MYVLPRAGRPTITMTHGAMATFAMSGHSAESKEKRWLSNVQGLFPSIADN